MINIGTKIKTMYIGDKKVKKAYMGTDLVYEDAPASYTVTGTASDNLLINGSRSYSGTIEPSGTLDLSLSIPTNEQNWYVMPTDISSWTYSGATFTYNRTDDTTGTLTISNPTSNVSFTTVADAKLYSVTVINNYSSGVGLYSYSSATGTRSYSIEIPANTTQTVQLGAVFTTSGISTPAYIYSNNVNKRVTAVSGAFSGRTSFKPYITKTYYVAIWGNSTDGYGYGDGTITFG